MTIAHSERTAIPKWLLPMLCVRGDIERLRSHPLVPEAIPIRGFIYDVRSGRLIELT